MKESKEYIVYKITSPESKVYIGSTSNFKRRIREYSRTNCKMQIKLYNSFIKYGFDTHTIEILWSGPIDLLLYKENEYGNFYNCLDRNKGLNLMLPKSTDKKYVMSDEMREKISKSKKGIKNPKAGARLKELYQNGSIIHWNTGKKGYQKAWNKGIPRTLSEKEKMSISKLEYFKTEEGQNFKKRLSNIQSERNRLKGGRLILDIVTGIYFYSIREASNSYNINYSTLQCKLINRIKNNTNLILIE